MDNDLKRLKLLPGHGRSLIESYEDAMKRFDLKKDRGYRFIVNPLREDKQMIKNFMDIFQKIEENILEREAQGISQETTRILLNQLFKSRQETPENLALFKELFIEANTQLGIFSLPEDIFGKYKELVRVTLNNVIFKQTGEDPRRIWKREMISAENQEERQIYTQLSDGQVPSFEEFKSVKAEIQRANQARLPHSPLGLVEKQDETVEQYLRLEAIARQFPHTRDRVNKL